MRSLWLFRYLPVLLLTVLATPAITTELLVEGVPNFHPVNARLFRGGQPSVAAWPKLAALGITTVIDLRRESEHSTAAEAKAVEAAGMGYVSFPMNGFATPSAEQIEELLTLIETGDTVFVHCKVGMDRTGVVVAAYRIAREHWANQQALDEAESLGMHWYSSGMKRFILDYRVPDQTAAEGAPSSDSTATPVLAP